MNGYEPHAATLPVTRWSLVAQAAGEPSDAKCRALEELLSLYMPALRAHLISRMRLPPELCEDLLQEFVAQKILDRDIIARADKAAGRFRTFLLTSLDRFVLNQIRDEGTYRRKRHALAERLRTAEPNDDADPMASSAFDVAWARQVIARTLDWMCQECETTGHEAAWTIFDRRVLGPLFRDEEPPSYEALAQQLGLASAKQASNLLITAKRTYARVLRQVICQYCPDSDIDREIAELKEILSHARA